jgi:hypothetical protein
MFEKQTREREAARIAAAREAELHPPPVAPTAPALQVLYSLCFCTLTLISCVIF